MFKFNFNQDPDPDPEEKKTEELSENLAKGYSICIRKVNSQHFSTFLNQFKLASEETKLTIEKLRAYCPNVHISCAKGDESRCVEHESVTENFECEKGLQVIEEVLGLKHIDCADVIENMDSKPECLNGNSDLVKNGNFAQCS